MISQPGTRVASSPGRGRGLLASRPFRAGELIASFGSPVLALPDGPGMRTMCNYCLRLGGDQSSEKPLRAWYVIRFCL